MIKPFFQKRESFTLVELLIVIGILAVLTAAVIIALNPAEYLKQARDAQRVQDIFSLNKALSALEAIDPDVGLGTASTVYVSVPDSDSGCANLGLPNLPEGWNYACVASSTLYDVDGTGWLPVNFASNSALALSALPIDPTNTTSSELYYTYTPGGSWVLTAGVESVKYQAIALEVSQNANDRYQVGTNTALVATTVYGGAEEAAAVVDAPLVTTSAATAASDVGATFNGTVNPNGNATTYWFEYGPTLSYGSSTDAQSAGSGSEAVEASASLSDLSSATQYYVRLVAQNEGGTTNGSAVSFYTDVSRTNLALWWKFDEASGTSALDSSGNSKTGTLYNTPSRVSGKSGNALQFNGTSNYVSIADPFYSDAFSISAWFDPAADAAGDKTYAIVKRDWTTSQNEFFLTVGNSAFSFRAYDSSNQTEVITIVHTYDPVTSDGWYHICITHDGSTAYYYVNGVYEGSVQSTGTVNNSTATFNVANLQNHTTRFFSGVIDDVRFYSRTLSDAEAISLYEALQ